MSTVTTIIQHRIGIPNHRNQRRKRNKISQIQKEKVKLSLFAGDMILYVENLKDFTRDLIELINKFSNVTGYKINIQISVASLN